MLATNFAEAGGFLRTRPDLPFPDVQLHFVVALVEDHARKLRRGHGYSCHVCLLRPRSRGAVTLRSTDPLAAPAIDPNFLGAGRTVTDEEGRYRFCTIKPGAYPWGNHAHGWRPNHIHFSLFGPSFVTRLVTQMYFPGDPLLALDPIYHSAPEGARERMVSTFSIEATEPGFALGYAFDIVLRGRHRTPMEH